MVITMKDMSINKGNYSVDTPERFEKYMKARGYMNEEAFQTYRKNWTEYPLRQYISEYPLSLEFQISDVCNLKCPFCTYKNGPDKFMDFSLFKKAIDETAGKVPAIRFNSTGESVLHPQFLEMVKYAKDHGAIEISFITNTGAISLDLFEKILLAGVDWMTVSIDGLYEEYEKNRYPLKFQGTYEKLKAMKTIKERYFSQKPAINIQGIWPFIEDRIEEYIDVLSPVCDYINYCTFVDFEKMKDSNCEPDFTCAQPFQRLLIQIDGEICPCCAPSDDHHLARANLGNLKEQSVFELWHSEALNKVRELCSAPGKYKELNMCRQCISPHKIKQKTVEIHGKKCVVNSEYL